MSAAGKVLASMARPIAQRAAPRAPAAMRSMSSLGEELGKVKDVPLKDAAGFLAGKAKDPKTHSLYMVPACRQACLELDVTRGCWLYTV
jgi:hypothetical protein